MATAIVLIFAAALLGVLVHQVGEMPSESSVPAAATAPAPAAAPSPQPTPQPSPQPSPQPTPQPQPAQAAGAQPTPAQAAFNLRQYAAQQNPQLAGVMQNFADDQAFARELLNVVQQTQALAPYVQMGQRFQPHAAEFEKFLAEKQAAAQAAQVQANQWWKAPEFDQKWLDQVYLDPNTNQMVAKPGAPVDLPQRIQAWRQFQSEKLNEFMRNPMDVLKPGLEQHVQPMIEQAIQAHLGRLQAAQFAQSYVQQNLGWIAAKDPQGNPMPDGRGGWVMTPAGQRMAHYVDQLNSSGITDPRLQQQIAQKMLLGDLAALQAQQAQNQHVQQQPQQPAFAPVAGGGNWGNPQAQPAKPGQSLQEALTEAFRERGLLGQNVV